MDELLERDDQTLFELCARLATKHGLGSTRQAILPIKLAVAGRGWPPGLFTW